MVNISDSWDFSAGKKNVQMHAAFELPRVEYLLHPGLYSISILSSNESLHGCPAHAKGGSLRTAAQQWLVSRSHKFASTDSAR